MNENLEIVTVTVGYNNYKYYQKKLMAIFCMCEGASCKCKSEERKRTHFGYKGGSTYIDHKDERTKG
jgi:hypothetical protein